MHKLSEVKCRINLVTSSKWHIVEMFQSKIHVSNSTADVSKTISHDKMLHYRCLIDIAVSKYNLPRCVKGGHISFCASPYTSFRCG